MTSPYPTHWNFLSIATGIISEGAPELSPEEFAEEALSLAYALAEVAAARLAEVSSGMSMLTPANRAEIAVALREVLVFDRLTAMQTLRDLARHAVSEGYASPGDVITDVANWEIE